MSSSIAKPVSDAQWALPLEVVTMIFEEVFKRYQRDYSGLEIPSDPYTILPLLCTAKSLKDHLLPLLYTSITMRTHRQLLSFLRNVDSASVEEIQTFTLEVDDDDQPPEPQFPTPLDLEYERSLRVEWLNQLREMELKKMQEVRVAVEELKARREKTLEYKRGEKDNRVLIAQRTSVPSLLVSECLKFPKLKLQNGLFGIKVKSYSSSIMYQSLLLPLRHLHLKEDVVVLSIALGVLRRAAKGFADGISMEFTLDATEDVERVSSARDLEAELAPEFHELKPFLSDIPGIAEVTFRSAGRPDEKSAHLYCEGQGGCNLRIIDKKVTYERCPDGTCPFRGDEVVVEAEDDEEEEEE